MPSSSPRIAIVGAGFGGVGLGMRLKSAGRDDFVILEKADGVGGVWRANTYPGAACDIPSTLYSFSFAPKPDWSRRYAPQAEILAYLEACAERAGLLPHCRFGRTITRAAFDASARRWRIEATTSAGEREIYEAEVFVCACGQLTQPAYPALDGPDAFAGPAFHSARWRHDVPLEGRRVAVVGTGASAVQFVPRLAERAAQVTVFQRSAPYLLPKPDRVYPAWERRLRRAVPAVSKAVRALTYLKNELRAVALYHAPALLAPFRLATQLNVRRGTNDPALRDALTPDYPLGCKRILIANDYVPALDQPHVALETAPIARVEADAVVTDDGRRHPADVLIYATGFRSTDFVAPMEVEGLGSRTLNEAWAGGAEAYLGLAVHGFPNFFLLYGPNTNLGHNSIVFMLEGQIRYVLDALRALDAGEAGWLNVRADVQEGFNERVQATLADSVFAAGCSSWYVNEAGRQTNNWIGFTVPYWWRTRRVDLDDFERVPTAEEDAEEADAVAA